MPESDRTHRFSAFRLQLPQSKAEHAGRKLLEHRTYPGPPENPHATPAETWVSLPGQLKPTSICPRPTEDPELASLSSKPEPLPSTSCSNSLTSRARPPFAFLVRTEAQSPARSLKLAPGRCKSDATRRPGPDLAAQRGPCSIPYYAQGGALLPTYLTFSPTLVRFQRCQQTASGPALPARSC